MHGLWQHVLPGVLPRVPLGVRTFTPQLVGGLLCVDRLSQALTPGKGPHWLSLILLTGLNKRLPLPQQPAITHGWHLSPGKG